MESDFENFLEAQRSGESERIHRFIEGIFPKVESIAKTLVGDSNQFHGRFDHNDVARAVILRLMERGLTAYQIKSHVELNQYILRLVRNVYLDMARERPRWDRRRLGDIRPFFNIDDIIYYYKIKFMDYGRAVGEGPQISDQTDDIRSQHFATLLATVRPTANAGELQDLNGLVSGFKQAVITRLTEALNTTLQGRPKDTLEQKQALSDFANETAAAYGLAVKCPKSGLPARLAADVGHYPGIGRFQIQATGPDGKRYRTSSDTLPELELVVTDPPSPTPHAKETPDTWQAAVGPSSQRKGRSPTD